MANRSEIKDQHEKSVLSSFACFTKNGGKSFDLIERPDPPDAIVKIDGADTWIEITDAFFSKEVAISITSYAAGGATHYPSKGGRVLDPDSIIANNLLSAIKEKTDKNTMKGQAKASGPGILLVGLYGPFVDINEIANNLSNELINEVASQRVFSTIYIYETDPVCGHVFKSIK